MSISSLLQLHTIRDQLADQTPQGAVSRQNTAKGAAEARAIGGLGLGISGVIALVALVAMRSFPVIGGLFALWGALSFVFAHEALALAENTLAMMNRDGEGNISPVNLSPEEFTNRITQNTWIIGPLFGSAIRLGLA